MNKKKSKIDLFAAGNDHTNACLNSTPFVDYGYIEGYRLGADLLVDHVGSLNRNHDLLVFPVVFLLRHHLELQLKSIVRDGRRLFDIDAENATGHSLRKLWRIARALMVKVDDSYPSTEPEYAKIQDLVEQFSEVDNQSTSFRYPRDLDGKPSLPGLEHINLTQLRDTTNATTKILDSFSGWILQNIEWKNEMHADCDSGW